MRSRSNAARASSSRYGGRISSEWYFPKLIELWLEDRECLRRRDRLHRGDRLDHLVADRPAAAPELHGRLQGDVVCRPRGCPRPATSRRPTPVSPIPAPSSAPSSCPLEPGPGRSPPSGPRALGLPDDVAVAVGNVDSFVSVPGAGVAEPRHVRDRDRHLDLRHGAGRRRRCGCPGITGRRSGRDPARALRLRGRTGRGRRHARVVRQNRWAADA